MSEYFAHTSGYTGGPWHLLSDHLRSVSDLAAQFAIPLGMVEEARLAGLLHDLGKYGSLFQDRLRNPTKIKGIDHWTIGAWAAIFRGGQPEVALSIYGHHVGLSVGGKVALLALDPLKFNPTSALKLSEPSLELLLDRQKNDGLLLQNPPQKPIPVKANGMLGTRMLFSTLVDADYLDTESHFDGKPDQPKKLRMAGPNLDVDAALAALDKFQNKKRLESKAHENIRALRDELSIACETAGEWDQGLYTLTAPTGSGKTLAMLRFALIHAKAHCLRRIVVVLPFLSLIDQTVQEYREVFAGFPAEFVLEDHSLAREETKQVDGVENRARLLAENWDAPIIITTNVRFFESLHQNRPGACRKLHRLAKSVVLCDEIQTLPIDLAIPTLATLGSLSKEYETTVVFATATQPAFDGLNEFVRELSPHGWSPLEIVPTAQNLFQRSSRVNVAWRFESQTWESLAEELAELPGTLVIVNTRKDAVRLTKLVQDIVRNVPILHISTSMCVDHRKQVLSKIYKEGFESRGIVISTQCVEAGIDLDFLRVYRAWGPLDSVAQAAGRCNRSGRIDKGEVVVFLPEDAIYPPGVYKQAKSTAFGLVKELGPENSMLNDPNLFDRFYRELYRARGVGITPSKVREAILGLSYEDVAKEYRLIENDGMNIVVRIGDALGPDLKEANDELLDELERSGLSSSLMRRLRRFTVSTFLSKDHNLPLKPLKTARGEVVEGWCLLDDDRAYDPLLGLRPDAQLAFII